MNSDEPDNVTLGRAAQRATTGPAPLIASLIKAWRIVSEKNAAAELDISERTLEELALCQRPRAELWIKDVGEISAALEIDLDRLASFLRAAEAFEVLKIAHPSDDALRGRLLAARDREGE